MSSFRAWLPYLLVGDFHEDVRDNPFWQALF